MYYECTTDFYYFNSAKSQNFTLSIHPAPSVFENQGRFPPLLFNSRINTDIEIVVYLDEANILLSSIGLTHNHTIQHFDAEKTLSCGKHCGKRRNCLQQANSPFLTMFSTLYVTYFSFEMHFKMSSTICINLNQSNILSSGNGLTYAITK